MLPSHKHTARIYSMTFILDINLVKVQNWIAFPIPDVTIIRYVTMNVGYHSVCA